jgi:hypothetical protein
MQHIRQIITTPWRLTGVVDLQIYEFLTSVLNRGEWSVQDPAALIQDKNAGTYLMGGWEVLNLLFFIWNTFRYGEHLTQYKDKWSMNPLFIWTLTDTGFCCWKK